MPVRLWKIVGVMPNAIAYIVLFSWPIVAVVLFANQPPARALSLSVIVGYLLLPIGTGIDFPMIPAIEKVMVINLTAAVVVYLALRREYVVSGKMQKLYAGRARHLFQVLIFLTLATPFISVLTNGEPVIAGPRYIQGINLYDAVSLMASAGIAIIPFVLGMHVLGTPAAQHELLRVLVVAACTYALLALFEIRMSPQLNTWIYGFFPHDFGQHMRSGGFRPVVFLSHGLALGIFLCMAVLGACALWRQAMRDQVQSTPWLAAALWLALTLLMSLNLGATALALLVAPLILFTPIKFQVHVAALVACIVLLYPMLRGAGLVPIDAIYSVAQSVSEDRAASLLYRLDNEDALLTRANEKPLAGWGSWGRNRIYDPETGRDLSVTDGLWVITIGQFGWFGYFAQFGLLAIPLIMLASLRTSCLTHEATGLSALSAVALIDLIPNATISPVTWIVIGAITGHVVSHNNALIASNLEIKDSEKKPIFENNTNPKKPDRYNDIVFDSDQTPSPQVFRHFRMPRK